MLIRRGSTCPPRHDHTKIYTKGWPASVLVMPHDVWATVPSRQALLRIDPETNAVLATIHLGGRPGAIALAPGALWVRVAFNTYSAAVRIDPSTDHIVASVPLGAIYGGIATTPGAVWVTGHDRGIVQRIDPRTNTVAATMRGTVEGGGIRSYLGAVWVYADGGSRVKVEPHTKTVITASAGVGHSNVTAGDGSLWLASNDDVLRIDPASATVRRRIRVTGCYPAPVGCSLVYGDGFVWMERSGAPPDDIYRIDPRTAHVRRVLRLSLGYPGYLLAAGHGALWGSGPDAIWRIAE